jgi:hypothetical protein
MADSLQIHIIDHGLQKAAKIIRKGHDLFDDNVGAGVVTGGAEVDTVGADCESRCILRESVRAEWH